MEHRISACWAGAFFLAANRSPAWVFYASDDGEVVSIVIVDSDGMLGVQQKRSNVSLTDRVVLCGPKVKDPAWVASFCQRFPTNPMYVCPLVDELPAFGVLAKALVAQGKDWPRRAVLFQPVTEELPALSSKEYEDNLDGDAYGRMVWAMSKGMMVFNDVMTGPGISFFHGRMLAMRAAFPENVYVINSESIMSFIPHSPVSLKLYAATSVPVLARVTDDFCKATGHQGDHAVVAVASDFIPGIVTFLHFYGAVTKGGVFCTGMISSDGMKGKLPVFRYNKMYLVDAQKYAERKCLL
jgi:hypothetical protein